MEHFFLPNLSGDLRSDAHQSQIIGGEADVHHTQIIGRDTVKIFGEYIPPFPPGFGTPAQAKDQEYRSKCSPKTKQKFLQKFFSGDLQKSKKSPSKFSAKFLAFPNQVLTFQRV